MLRIISGPPSFYLPASIINIMGLVITLVLAYYCYKAYKLTTEKNYSLFSVSFVLLSLGLISTIIINVILVFSTRGFGRLINLLEIWNWLYILFFLMAYLLMFFIYFKRKKIMTSYILILMVLFSIVYFFESFALFNLISISLLAYIIFKLRQKYIKRKSKNIFNLIAVFLLLVLQHFFFLFLPFHRNFYLIAYFCLISALILLLKFIIGKNERPKK